MGSNGSEDCSIAEGISPGSYGPPFGKVSGQGTSCGCQQPAGPDVIWCPSYLRVSVVAQWHAYPE